MADYHNGNIPEECPFSGPGMQAPIASVMQAEIIANEETGVWILHEKPFPEQLDWIEYDQEMNVLHLVGMNGHTNELGLSISPDIAQYLLKATNIKLVKVTDGKSTGFDAVRLMVREAMF